MTTEAIKALVDLEDKSKALLHELDLWQDSIHPMPLPQHLLEDAVLVLKADLAAIEALKPLADGTHVIVPNETIDETFLRLKGASPVPVTTVPAECWSGCDDPNCN